MAQRYFPAVSLKLGEAALDLLQMSKQKWNGIVR